MFSICVALTRLDNHERQESWQPRGCTRQNLFVLAWVCRRTLAWSHTLETVVLARSFGCGNTREPALWVQRVDTAGQEGRRHMGPDIAPVTTAMQLVLGQLRMAACGYEVCDQSGSSCLANGDTDGLTAISHTDSKSDSCIEKTALDPTRQPGQTLVRQQGMRNRANCKVQAQVCSSGLDTADQPVKAATSSPSGGWTNPSSTATRTHTTSHGTGKNRMLMFTGIWQSHTQTSAFPGHSSPPRSLNAQAWVTG